MGLDTTHDCWHGPYSFFNTWREALHEVIDGRDTLHEAWERGAYRDQTAPLNVLMNHSDCDGFIAAEVCAPLADALEALLPQHPPDGRQFSHRWNTEQFITGLRKAAAAGERVEFH